MSRALPVMFVQATSVWTAHHAHLHTAHPQSQPHGLQPPAAELLPTRARGRASLLTRMIAEVVEVAAKQGNANLHSTPLLVGSTLGEIDTTVQLLTMMNEGDGALSPARFQASVHNAAAGQLSIATGNQNFSSCVTAGPGTAVALLLDAYAWLASEGGTILVAMADEAVPEILAHGTPQQPAACALLLSMEHGQETLASLSVPSRASRDVKIEPTPASADALSQQIGPSPVVHLLRVVEAALDAQLTGAEAILELPTCATPHYARSDAQSDAQSGAWQVTVKAVAT